MRHIITAFFLIFAFFSGTKAIAAPEFSFPVDCKLEENCWFVNYIDMDPEQGQVTDPLCQSRSYDNHKGTDIGIRSRGEMRQGVKVRAANDGQIKRIRDGQSDDIKTQEELQAIFDNNKGCGNGVLIDHGGTVQTFYCHLKEGSLKVSEGDKVKEGDIIGEIGQSGFAEFPHLHFEIRWENAVMDPFTGSDNQKGCGIFRQSLWKDNTIKYTPISIYDGEFRNNPPDFKAIEYGENNPEILSLDSDALVFWVAFYGAQKNDQITMDIKDPNGILFSSRNITQPKDRARQYYYTGRKLAGKNLPKGLYSGSIKISRKGETITEKNFTVHME